MKGGLGARAFALGPLKVGAIVAVNACGDIVDPETHETLAGMRAAADSLELANMEEAMLSAGANMVMPLDRTNTTIACIVTNAHLTKAQATKVAQMAADAYAHTIRPTHTTNDGDTIYVMASGASETPAGEGGRACCCSAPRPHGPFGHTCARSRHLRRRSYRRQDF